MERVSYIFIFSYKAKLLEINPLKDKIIGKRAIWRLKLLEKCNINKKKDHFSKIKKKQINQ